MIDISVQNLVKAFEVDENIIDDISFEVQAGQRVGLLGKNGAGKTTLFRLLVGEISEDEGEIVFGTGKRLGLISQIPDYPDHFTAEDVLKVAHQRLYDLQTQMERLAEEMANDTSKELLARYDKTQADFTRLGGWDMEVERNRIAGGLGIGDEMRGQLFSSLSGGEKTRVNLARLILEQTDILLLDEPTNHLDLKSVQWLEGYLAKFPGTVMVISHDRYFLDSVVSRVIEIEDGKLHFYPGNYSFYVDEKARRIEEASLRYEREQAEIKRLGQRAEQMVGWGTGNKRMAKKAKAMMSRIERMQRTEKPKGDKQIHAAFGEKEFRGDLLFSVKGLSKAYDTRTLFSDIELTVTGGERIALIGDNGTGKSTFLRILLGELKHDAGKVNYGPTVKKAYLPQHVHFEHPNRSMVDTLVYELGCSTQTARNRLGAFLFSGEDVFTPVSVLSGGQKSRLRLCMLMDNDLNLLVLDEPTNHLDIPSREWMEEALEEYSEALLFVSHDRYFISRFATRIWILENGTITDFHGGYEEYLRSLAVDTHVRQIEKKKAGKSQKQNPKKAPSVQKQVDKLEKEIAKLEEEKNTLLVEMEEKSSDYMALIELEQNLQEKEQALKDCYEHWEELMMAL